MGVIFSFSSSILSFRLLISEFRLVNHLANLASLAQLRLCCLFIKGESNLGLSLSSIGSEV